MSTPPDQKVKMIMPAKNLKHQKTSTRHSLPKVNSSMKDTIECLKDPSLSSPKIMTPAKTRQMVRKHEGSLFSLELIIHTTDLDEKLEDEIVFQALTFLWRAYKKSCPDSALDQFFEDESEVSPFFILSENLQLIIEDLGLPHIDRIECLETLISSVQFWAAESPTSRGYLDYIGPVFKEVDTLRDLDVDDTDDVDDDDFDQ